MKFLARTSFDSTDYTQIKTNDLNHALRWIGKCKDCMGTIYRISTGYAIYQIERGRLNFDRRMEKERA